MSGPALHPGPRPGDVVRAQIRATGFALARFALVAAGLAVLATVLIALEVLRTGESIHFHPEHQMLPGVAGLLLPLFIWMGEERFGPGFLWTLPVDRRRHALVRVFAGWVWLMTGLALFVAWLLGLCLFSGGNILAGETLLVLPSPAFPAPGALDPGDLRSVPWTPEPLLWLVPFSAATCTYLLASALALAVRHPVRWIAGAVLGIFLVAAMGHAADADWLVALPERLLEPLLNGPYGLDALLTARTESLKIDMTLSTGKKVVVWRALPTLGQWVAATWIWGAAGIFALGAAASRHGERRRA